MRRSRVSLSLHPATVSLCAGRYGVEVADPLLLIAPFNIEGVCHPRPDLVGYRVQVLARDRQAGPAGRFDLAPECLRQAFPHADALQLVLGEADGGVREINGVL